MNALEFLNELNGSSIEESLMFVKDNGELGAVVLQDSKGTQFAVSKRHIEEMGDAIQVTKKGKEAFLVAKWRKAGQNSFWLRADEGQSRGKITLADILA